MDRHPGWSVAGGSVHGGRAREGQSAWTRRAKSRSFGSARSVANAGPSGSQSGSVALASSTSTSPPSTGRAGPASKYLATKARTSSSVRSRSSFLQSRGYRLHARRTSPATCGGLMGVSTKSLESDHIPARCTAASSSPVQYRSVSPTNDASFIASEERTRGAKWRGDSARPRKTTTSKTTTFPEKPRLPLGLSPLHHAPPHQRQEGQGRS